MWVWVCADRDLVCPQVSARQQPDDPERGVMDVLTAWLDVSERPDSGADRVRDRAGHGVSSFRAIMSP